MQYSVAVRNRRLNAIEEEIGPGAILKFYHLLGPAPANCAAAINGDVLATLFLPDDWMDPADSGIKSKSGTWQDLDADAPGQVNFFRIFAADGVTCGMQGTVTTTGDGGNMEVANPYIEAGQTITVTNFAISGGNG